MPEVKPVERSTYTFSTQRKQVGSKKQEADFKRISLKFTGSSFP